MKNKIFVAFALIAIICLAGFFFRHSIFSRNTVNGPGQSSADKSLSASDTSGKNSKDGHSFGNGRDTADNADGADEAIPVPKYKNALDYGTTPHVKGNINPQVKSAVEAKITKSHPERLSILLSPKPFDPDAYRNNSADYLGKVEPGRVFQTATPKANTPQIKAISPNFQRMEQGQRKRLMVQAAPHWPVTWTSTSLGQFANKLTSITVEADAQGIAETTFAATSGTIDDVYILCASPMASGQLRFVVNVSKPGEKL